VLDRLRQVADDFSALAPELRGEYERWRLRFDLLASGGALAAPAEAVTTR